MKTLDPVLYRIRKEAILQQARHLFATRGFAETSMDDIAQSNHMQKASLYHYFKSKQEILEDMILMEGERWSAQVQDEIVGPDLAEKLRRFSFALLKFIDETAGREFFKIIHFESHKNPVIFKAFKESPMCRRGPLYTLFEKHFQKRFSTIQIAMLVTQFVGGLIHYVNLSRMREENMCLEKFSDDAYVHQWVDIFTHGVSKL